MSGVEVGDFGSPDETRAPDKTTVEIVRMGGVAASRMRLEPGWRWSECIKPVGRLPATDEAVCTSRAPRSWQTGGHAATLTRRQPARSAAGSEGRVAPDDKRTLRHAATARWP
jgi:hypothetical protein